MKVNGNLTGIANRYIERMEAMYDFPVEREQLISPELAAEMADITAALNKEIAVYLDRRGRVAHVALGSDFTVPLEELTRRRGERGLSGLRCVHTHPGGDGTLSMVDFSALEAMHFDCMAAIGVRPDGSVSNGEVAFIGAGGKLAGGSRIPFRSLEQMIEFSFLPKLTEIDGQDLPLYQIVDDGDEERALLVGMDTDGNQRQAEESLAELAELSRSAGLVVIGQSLQRRSRADASTYVGKGKSQEIQLAAQAGRADVLVFDDELTPAQQRNLEKLTGIKVVDRTMLILDIFAQRARSSEGKLQVELAQLKYLLPRLMGQGISMSRLGGGIGTRGPGETKLEVDRRQIRKRITDLEEKLETVSKARDLHRRHRESRDWPVVALVGYTNAGKSTLLNTLTGSEVLVENKLFATLDPTTRMIHLPDKREALLTDTVGFIRKLPHHLVAAFRATLEETLQADLLVHVVDASSDQAVEQVEAVNTVLKSLEAGDKPTLIVLNKIDQVADEAVLEPLLLEFSPAVAISAKNGIGLTELLAKIQSMLPVVRETVQVLLPFKEAALAAEIHAKGVIISEEYRETGVTIVAEVDARLKKLLENYLL